VKIPRWTEKEELELRTMYGLDFTEREIVSRFHRTWHSIWQHCRIKGFERGVLLNGKSRTGQRWTENDLDIMHTLIVLKLPADKLGHYLVRPIVEIMAEAKRVDEEIGYLNVPH
jgi:hypothetical protein